VHEIFSHYDLREALDYSSGGVNSKEEVARRVVLTTIPELSWLLHVGLNTVLAEIIVGAYRATVSHPYDRTRIALIASDAFVTALPHIARNVVVEVITARSWMNHSHHGAWLFIVEILSPRRRNHHPGTHLAALHWDGGGGGGIFESSSE
jgi:hypothetical protein